MTAHNFQTLYAKYFEGWPGSYDRRGLVHKLFEIGLGCHGRTLSKKLSKAGRSVRLWRAYFPNTDIWFADYDVECITAYKDKLELYNIRVVSGDQSDADVLNRWVQETGGNFDVIIDDGAHQNVHMYNSLVVLFSRALKPGGLYVIEDLEFSRLAAWKSMSRTSKASILDVLKDWMEQLATWTQQHRQQDAPLAYKPKYRLLPRVKSIECVSEACAIVKCYEDDPSCFYGAYEDEAVALW